MSKPETDLRAAVERTGLSSAEAAERLRLHGRNILPARRAIPVWRQLAAQFVHFFALMLWVAGGLAFFAGMPQLGYAVFAVIVLNGVFAFAQEYRAERATEKLRDLLPRRARVMRDGVPQEIDASGLVVGDLVLLQAGDRISADLLLAEAFSLSLDMSALTGESIPVAKQAGDTALAGTFVTEGQGKGVVEATGERTRLAGIAQLARQIRRPRTPLAQELDRVVRVLSVAALAVGLLFLIVAAVVGIRLTDAFLFALGVVVALVPEGLLPTVTLSLAWGAQRMAQRNALVRKLESVETLGATTFICTDKTGTLTLNEMSVTEVWTPSGAAAIDTRGYAPTPMIRADSALLNRLRDLAQSATYGAAGRTTLQKGRWVALGNPLEAAIDAFARKLGVLPSEALPATVQVVFPFDPRRRRVSVFESGVLHVRGAPESVFPLCETLPEAEDALSHMTERGLRVIAVARRIIPDFDPSARAEDLETGLELLGLIGVEDPPRPGIAESIAACRRAGIKIAMVTGDHSGTARSVAVQVGLASAETWVIEGKDLPQDEALLGSLVDRDGIVICRATPEDKVRIARALKSRGHIVAMTGDGVNDGPALQEATIGVAMGRSGTDVAREAADLVLLDDNFATIVAAVEQGRATFANARRFLTYHLTDNVAELAPFVLWALSGGRFPLALSVLQVLALDLGTDVLPALALGAEPPSPQALQAPPRRGRLLDRPVLVRAFGLLGPVEAVVEIVAFLVTLSSAGWRPGAAFPTGDALLAASGAAFSAVVVGQMANAFACRSATRWPGSLGWTSNQYVVFAVIAELIILIGLLSVTPLARLLNHAPPNAVGGICAVLAFPAVLFADILYKRSRGTRSLVE